MKLLQIIKRYRSNRLTRNTFWATMLVPLNVIFGTFQTALSARILGPEGLGLIAIFAAAVAILSSIVTLQNGTTIITFLSRSLEQKKVSDGSHVISFCFIADFLSGCIGFILLAILTLAAPDVIHLKIETGSLFLFFGTSVVISSTYWDSHSVLRVLDRTDITFKVALWQSIIKSLLLFVCYHSFRSINGYIAATLISALFGNCCLALLSYRQLLQHGIRPSVVNWWKIPSEISRYSIQGFGQKILKTLIRYADTILLGFFTSITETGRYRASHQLTDYIQMPMQGYISSLYAEYSRLFYAHDIERLRSLLIKSVMISGTIGIACSLALLVFMKPIVRIVLGATFIGIEPVISVLILLPVITLIFAPLTFLPSMTGNQKPVLYSLLFSLFIQLLLLPILIPRFGAIGAAWTAVISSAISQVSIVIPVIKILSQKKRP
jgi:O-antigen/teichoic acid export membrane protein